jgi:hypothetical protein
MTYWPFWLSGLALAGVAVGHWLLTRRNLAVSGRYSALVDRARHGDHGAGAMSEQDLVAAIQAATSRQFGSSAAPDCAAGPVAASEAATPSSAPAASTSRTHVIFLGGLVLGGLLSVLLAGDFHPVVGLHAPAFEAIFGAGAFAYAPLLLGGLFVGFGTRMAGGCTSGHGLCGVSRFQPGSLVATASFFGMGIVASLVLGWLS